MAKRLLSLVVAMLLVLSLAPVALASTDAAIAAVAAEAISTEPLGFVTKNLTLPTEVEETVISWQSSDPSVIATNGTVTRHAYEDKTVTLTASVGSDTIATHEVTVLSQLKTVGFSDTFKVDDTVTSYVNVNGWTRSSTNMDLIPVEDAANNTVLTIHTAITSAEGTVTGTQQAIGYFNAPLSSNFPNGVGTSGVYTIEFDHYPCATDSGYSMQFRNNGSANNHTARVNFRNNELTVFNYASGNQWYVYSGALDTGKELLYNGKRTSGNPDHVKYQYNPTTGKFSLTYNGNIIVASADSQVATTGSGLTGIGFYLGHRNASELDLSFSVDNLVVYTEDVLSDDMINTWTDAQKVEFFASKVDVDKITATPELVTSNLDLAAAFTGYELANYGVSLTWSSSNTARITNAGVVDNTSIFDENVTMTATVSCGEASKSFTKTVTVGQPKTKIAGVAGYFGDFESYAEGATTGSYTYTKVNDEHSMVAKVTNNATAATTGIYGDSKYYDARFVFEADVKFVEEEGYTVGNNPKLALYTFAGNFGTQLTFDFTNRKIQATRANIANNRYYNSTEGASIDFDMPAALQEGEWFNLVFDYIAPAKGINVYINGVLLNEIPIDDIASSKSTDYTSGTIRGYSAYAPTNGSLYVDNVSLKKYTDADIIKVDAALEAFKLTYLSGREIGNLTLSADAGAFPTAGPTTAAVRSTNYAPYNYMQIDFTGGATLSYKINGVAATGIDANTLPNNATIEVTATSGNVSKTITANVNIGSAGVKLVRTTSTSAAEFDSVHVLGDVVGKKVIVALVDDDGKIYQILPYTITAEDASVDVTGAYRVGLNGSSFCPAADAVGKYLKVFILDENLKPYSMPFIHKITGVIPQ